jgi:hypothetical protein
VKNVLYNKIIVLIVAVACSIQGYASSRTALGSGDWNDPTNWVPAGVPACGDSIIIPATYTVYVSNQQNYTGCATPLKIIVYGEMMFLHGSKLSLPCSSYVIIFPGGIIDHDQGLASSNLINICGNVEWDSNSTIYGLACLPPSLAYCASVLPIELVSFTVETHQDDKIYLKWETVTETDNDHYEVERSSDAADFENICIQNSKAPGGNSLYKIDYAYRDEEPLTGTNYYRLKQVDRDGSFTYSKIISAHLDEESEMNFMIYPNYDSNVFTAKVSGLNSAGSMTILLRDVAGNIVYKVLNFVNDTNVQINIAPEMKLTKGYYFCSFIVHDKEHIVKMLVTDF